MKLDPMEPAVEERLWQLTFDELAGRERAPDRKAEILRRAGAVPRAPRSVAGGRRVLMAAVALLGLALPFVVSRLARERPGPEPAPSPAGPTKLAGTDPADLRALRSAEAMLAAEQGLAQQLAEGRIVGVDWLPFDQLTAWRYERGLVGMPEEVRALDGRRVLMTGFMLPIDEVEGMRQFLLVKSLWACCYGQPPDVNGIVRCVMPAGQGTDYRFEPLKVFGTFTVSATEQDGYVVDVFQLHVDRIEPIE